MAAALVAVALAGGGSGRKAVPAGDYVARLRGTNAFVAVLVGRHGGVLAYVCDSKGVAEWFKGRAAKLLSLHSKAGYVLGVTFAGRRATGSVRFPSGRTRAFVARSVRRPAGLYRVEIRDGAKTYLGGWIVLADGSTRGAAKQGTRIVGSTTLSFTDPISTF